MAPPKKAKIKAKPQELIKCYVCKQYMTEIYHTFLSSKNKVCSPDCKLKYFTNAN